MVDRGGTVIVGLLAVVSRRRPDAPLVPLGDPDLCAGPVQDERYPAFSRG
jgi:hypothetical protein